MPLTLRYHGQTGVPVEIEGLTPDWARDKSPGQIERFELYHGNRKLPAAEFFQVAGDASDGTLVFEGDLAGVHWIGAKMNSGTVRVEGTAGRHLGSEMTGGQIHVSGNAGDWVGGEMHGGLIHVRGSAGHLVGSAYRGSPKGVTRGTILVDGDAGNEIGLSMRRGLIAVGGKAGDVAGLNMIAGTILLFGEVGIRHGAAMSRGTIGLLGPNPPKMIPTFRHACRFRSLVLALLFGELLRLGFAVPEVLQEPGGCEVELYNGDLLDGGRGEILVRERATA